MNRIVDLGTNRAQIEVGEVVGRIVAARGTQGGHVEVEWRRCGCHERRLGQFAVVRVVKGIGIE